MKNFLFLLTLVLLCENSYAGGWEQKADFGGIARHRTTMLTIGNKVYSGLGHYNGAGINVLFDDWWEYDPSTNSWSQKANYLGGVCYHATGFVINNIAYVGTGRTSENGNTLVQDFFKYSAATNTWTQIASYPGVGRRGAISFVVGNFGYVGTGETAFDLSSAMYRFDPSTESWTPVASLPTVGRTSSVAFSIGNYGYVGTGQTDWGSVNDFWQYNPATDTWTQKAVVGPTNRLEACGFAVGGKGYIGTGADVSNGDGFGDMWEYNPSLDTWVQIEDFPGTARRYFTATTLNEFVYASMGTNGTNFKDLWQFDQTVSLLERALADVELQVYPNPASDFVTIEGNWNASAPLDQVILRVTSISGKTVYEERLNSTQEIRTDSWTSGSYIYSLEYNNRSIKSGQLIISNK